MAGTQIVLPTTFTGAGASGLPFIIHGLPGPAPAHRYLPYALPAALGTNVSMLPDQNGALPLARGVADQQPSLETSPDGLPPHLLFNITPNKESLQASKAAPGSAISIAVVFEYRAAPANQYMVRYGGKNIALNGSGNVIAGEMTSSAPSVGTSRTVVVARFSSADSKVWVNGIPSTGPASPPTASDPSILWAMSNSTAAFRGYELALWDVALSDSQAAALTATIMSTWGIS